MGGRGKELGELPPLVGARRGGGRLGVGGRVEGEGVAAVASGEEGLLVSILVPVFEDAAVELAEKGFHGVQAGRSGISRT